MNDEKPVFCVVGAGHGGMAMAGHLALLGFQVYLLNRSAERLSPVRERGGIDVTGAAAGFAKTVMATDKPEEAVPHADVIMVVVPATGHRTVAEMCAPHLRPEQIVILNPGRTFGAIEFYQVLRRFNGCPDVIVGETQTFLYASRITGPGQVRIFRIKNSVPLATVQAHLIPPTVAVIRRAFPQFVPGDNVFKTSFNNIGAVFHPALTILNAGWIEDRSDFEFYHQGASSSIVSVLEKIDAERVQVAAALGIQAITAREWLYFAYDAVGKNLLEAMRDNVGYSGILAPHRTQMRYITEDVPCSLVPISSLGHQLSVATPAMDALIELASVMHGVEYREIGRNMKRIGIDQLSIKELRLMAIGELGPTDNGKDKRKHAVAE
ncbi:NAD/NADP octopine/nopaline dehydrogenase family protein [candidate division KSB1 bacterium]|nr:NAD/NADP octopine/nopaline dehydrogenase family protein [candidate division KSB1 bacterium]